MTDQNYRILGPEEVKLQGDQYITAYGIASETESWEMAPSVVLDMVNKTPALNAEFKFRRPIPPVAKSATTEPVKESLATDTRSEIERLKKEKDGILIVLEAVTENCLAMKLRAEKAEALQGEANSALTWANEVLAEYRGKLQTAERERDEARADLKTVVDGVIDALGISKPGSQSIFWYIESLRKERDALRAENARLREFLKYLDKNGGLGRDTHARIQAALAGKGEK